MIHVTNWEKVSVDDFYLTDSDWTKGIENIKDLIALAENGELFVAYEIEGDDYAVFHTMDAHQILIDSDCNVLMRCETSVIETEHEERWKATD